LGGIPSSCHCEAQSAEAIPKLNPKLKALSPKQIPISKFKVQNRFGHSDLGHLILFSISDLEFCFAGIATPSARNDNDKKLAMTGGGWIAAPAVIMCL
jgi:hypothetical protein